MVDPYATAKYFSELLCDAAMRRSDIRCITIRPSWVQWEGNYAANLVLDIVYSIIDPRIRLGAA